MSKYAQVTIGHLCYKITDGSHFSPENDEGGVFPMYSVKDMEYNGFAKSGYKTIGKDVFSKLSKSDCRPLKNDILIAKDGSYLKYVFKVKETLDACILSSIAILRPNPDVIVPDYFVHLLRLSSVRNAMANYVSGSALPRIILSDFKKMKLTIHSDLAEQQEIASILSTYDNLIENNTKRIKLLEQMAENLYKEWFVRFRFPGHENVEMENGLPKGWNREKLGNLCPILTGKKDANFSSANGSYKFFTCSKDDLTADSFSFDCFAIILAGNGDLNVKLYKGQFEAYQRTYVLSPYNLEHIFVSYYTIKSELDRLLAGAAGAVIKFLTKGMIGNIKVVIPPQDLLSKFNKLLEDNYCMRQNLLQQSQLLTKQRDLLLPRLMSGKLVVRPFDMLRTGETHQPVKA